MLGHEAASAHVARLVALAQDSAEAAGIAAVESLVLLGEVRNLAPFLTSPQAQVRRVAIVEIARSPDARVEHARLIAENISHADPAVRLAAVQATGDIGSAASSDHIRLLGALRGNERTVRIRKGAVQALGRVGEKGV